MPDTPSIKTKNEQHEKFMVKFLLVLILNHYFCKYHQSIIAFL